MAYLEPILGGLAAFLLGFAWYTALFGKAWQAETGISDEQAQSGMALKHGGALLMMIIISYGINTMINYHDLESQTFVHGAFHGATMMAGMGLPLMVINYLYQHKSFKLMLIDGAYAVAFSALSGGVMAALKLGASATA